MWCCPTSWPAITSGDRVQKLRFYERYGVREFYAWDPMTRELSAFHREGPELVPVNPEGGLVSPLLGVRFDVRDEELRAWRPDGRPFLSVVEMDAARERDQARARADALAAKLRELGVELD